MSRVDNALLLRDTIQKIVNDKIGKTNPGSSYATVTGFNPALGIITVRYPGDDVDIEIPAGSIYPSKPGQIVRVEGPTGSRVVADVKGENLTEVKARTAQETADGKNTVNYGETPPEGTDHKDGDIWFDESNSNMPHVWNGTEWKSIEDLRVSAIKAAQDELKADLDTIVENGVGTKSFYKPTEPTAAESKEGDLWFDTSESGNNELHTYVNGQWVSAADARIAALKDAQTQMTGDISAAQSKADEAFQSAADAESKAATAQSKADLADDKAQALIRASNSIVPNGDFENQSPNIWPNTTYQAGISVIEVPHARSGTHVMRMDSTSANRYPLTDWRSSAAGRIYYAEVWVYHNDTDMTRRGRVSFYAQSEFKDGSTTGYYGQDLDGTYVYVYQDQIPVETWTKVSAYVTAPEGTINIRVAPHCLSNETPFDFDDFKVIDVTESIGALREADQAKADAASAQATADQAKSDAAAAQTAASNAQSTATEALTSANSKNAVTRSTSNPSSSYTGRVDDIWWKMSTLSSGGRVIAQYRWNGTAWLTETIDNAVIANLDAAKITTGYLDAARIKANTLNADTVLINGSLGSIILRDGAITTPKIAVGAITAQSGIIASLDAGKITVGTLDVARLAANSITADKLLIGSGGNLLPVRGFVDNGRGWGSVLSYSTGGKDGSTIATVPASTSTTGGYLGSLSGLDPSYHISVTGGGVYSVSVWVRASVSIPAGRAVIYCRSFTTADGAGNTYSWPTPSSVSNTEAIPANTWSLVTGQFKMPEGAVEASIGLYAASSFNQAVDFCLPSFQQAVGSTLIEPGAITTEKIATGAITAESGVIGSLDASKITVGKLSGARLEADAINGMQIIGATIATSTGFPRVQLDTAGIAVYKSSTVRSFFADAKTGNLDLVGNLATATSGNERVVLDNALWNSIEVVDEEGNLAGSVAGSGISVGIGGQATLDLFHAGRSIASSGSYVDSGSIMGPRPTGQTRGAILSLSRTIRTDKSEFNWASLDVGKANGYYTARVGVTDADGSAFINANGPVRVTSGSNFSVVSSRDVLIQSSRDVSLSPGGNYGQLKLTAVSDDGARRTQQSVSPSGVFSNIYNSTWRHEVVAYPQQWSTQFIKSGSNSFDNGMSMTPEHFTVLSGGASLRINNVPTSATTWSTDFGRNLTPWGYIGSPSGVGADDFGIQSAAGKRLVLNAGTGSAKITLGTDGSITGLPMAGGRGSTGTMVANTPKAVAVTFPSGRFTGTPNVSLTISSTVPGKTVTGCGVAGISKTGFTAYITRTNTTSTSFEWTAIEAN